MNNIESVGSGASTQVTWMSADTIQVVWQGRIDGDAMRGLLRKLEGMVGVTPGHTPRYWYSDTSRVTNYSVDIRKPAIDLISFLKQNGMVEIVGVVDSPTIRMLSMSLSFVVGVKIKLFPSPEGALTYLRKPEN